MIKTYEEPSIRVIVILRMMYEYTVIRKFEHQISITHNKIT